MTASTGAPHPADDGSTNMTPQEQALPQVLLAAARARLGGAPVTEIVAAARRGAVHTLSQPDRDEL